MSSTISIKAYSDMDNAEYNKHYRAVQFCVENELTYPVETSAFFKGTIDGCNLEDFHEDIILDKISDGVEIPMPIQSDNNRFKKIIRVSDIPPEVDRIIVSLA